jgi:hypothetical protein
MATTEAKMDTALAFQAHTGKTRQSSWSGSLLTGRCLGKGFSVGLKTKPRPLLWHFQGSKQPLWSTKRGPKLPPRASAKEKCTRKIFYPSQTTHNTAQSHGEHRHDVVDVWMKESN